MCQYSSILQAPRSDLFITAPTISTDKAGFENAILGALETWGHINGLVLNAGTVDPLGPISGPTSTLDAWRQAFEINFFSLVGALQTTIPLLRANGGDISGRVIFVSSGASTGNTYGWAPYNSSKAAMKSLCRCVWRHRYVLPVP